MTHPNFSGTWKFNSNRSSLQIALPESIGFVIEHREPQFHFERTLVVGGHKDTFAIDLTTDGNTLVTHHEGLEIRATLIWDGDSLLFDSKVERDGVQGTNVVRYTLSEDGHVFTAEEQFRSSDYNYDNLWVFDKLE